MKPDLERRLTQIENYARKLLREVGEIRKAQEEKGVDALTNSDLLLAKFKTRYKKATQ